MNMEHDIAAHIVIYSALMTEAATALAAIPPEIFESLGIRYPLCDELCGAAGMAKEDAVVLRASNAR